MASEITAVMTVARNRRVCALVGIAAAAGDGNWVDVEVSAEVCDGGKGDGVNRADAETTVALASVTINSGG